MLNEAAVTFFFLLSEQWVIVPRLDHHDAMIVTRPPPRADLLTGAVDWILCGSVIRPLVLELFEVRTAIYRSSYHEMGTWVGASGLLIHNIYGISGDAI